jgi:glycosyltransferase involved in cell wall biosynthesis
MESFVTTATVPAKQDVCLEFPGTDQDKRLRHVRCEAEFHREQPAIHPAAHRFRIAIVTSVHPDFDARLWKYARLLCNLGHEVHLFCPWDVESGKRDGVVLHPFQRVTRRWMSPFQIPWRLGKVLCPMLSKVEVVHFHDIDILPWMTLLSLFKPTIYDVHENYPEEMLVREWVPDPLRRLLSFCVRWMQVLCAAVIRNVVLVIEAQNDDLFGPTLRKTIVANYAATELLQEVRPDYMERPTGIIFLGSQYENNGSGLLVEIADRLRRHLPDAKVYAIDRFSTSAYKQELMAEVGRRGLQDTYILLPNVPPHAIMDHLNRCTIAVAPNLRVPKQLRALPTKLFEYMAAGLPIVASDLPQAVAIVGGSNAGLLARPEDPSTFVDAICRLANNRAYARELGLNGQRAFRERYSWESQAGVIQSFYERVLLGRCSQIAATDIDSRFPTSENELA